MAVLKFLANYRAPNRIYQTHLIDNGFRLGLQSIRQIISKALLQIGCQ